MEGWRSSREGTNGMEEQGVAWFTRNTICSNCCNSSPDTKEPPVPSPSWLLPFLQRQYVKGKSSPHQEKRGKVFKAISAWGFQSEPVDRLVGMQQSQDMKTERH